MAELLAEVADYYTAKLVAHGATAQGVDWNSAEGQEIRFAQLSKIISGDGFSVTDIGCGYGAMHDYLAQRFTDFTYTGIDVSAAMVAMAKQRHGSHKNASFSVGSIPPTPTDYCVASGIFNVRQQRGEAEWRDYVLATLDRMAQSSRTGFAANFLPLCTDEARRRNDLYYADPDVLAAHCARYGEVTVLRDYGIFEFTLLVRKP